MREGDTPTPDEERETQEQMERKLSHLKEEIEGQRKKLAEEERPPDEGE
jgi:hypothetical protein